MFALLNAVVATFALNGHAAADRPEHAVAHLRHVAATGRPAPRRRLGRDPVGPAPVTWSVDGPNAPGFTVG